MSIIIMTMKINYYFERLIPVSINQVDDWMDDNSGIPNMDPDEWTIHDPPNASDSVAINRPTTGL